jgi:hypothetical protein
VDQARRFGSGLGYFAPRTDAPILPLVLGGAHELFWGRRIVLRVLRPVTARDLLGLASSTALPEPWAPEERADAHRIGEELHRRTVADVAQCHRLAESRPRARKPMRWLTSLFH